ncbi:MAG: trypsin-like peptidase domain-containing protein [bacterium]
MPDDSPNSSSRFSSSGSSGGNNEPDSNWYGQSGPANLRRRESPGAPPSPPPPTPEPTLGRRQLAGVAAIGLASALVGGIVGGIIVSRTDGNDATISGNSPGDVSSVSVEQTSAIAEAAANARPSVVRIESTKRNGTSVEQDVGSGVVLDNEGHILTNAHVVLGTDSLKVILSDGTERGAILVGHDFPFTDVAVLQIGPGKLTPIPVGDSSRLKLGEAVVAIGNPLAEFDGSVSVGVVSGLDRVRNFDGVRQDDLIQTDAAVNNGNSGGALVNLEGQFVGMPTAVLRESRSGASVEGIAFALPSNRLLEIARTIIQQGGQYPRPTLQLDHQDLTPEVLAKLGRTSVREGAVVVGIIPNGAADVAGIQPGDILTRIGDQPIDATHPLFNVLMGFAPGDSAKVVLNRNGRIIETEVRLGKRS